MENNIKEQIPDNVRELGISQEYFDKIHGLYLAANKDDFMAFFRLLQEQNITINF